MARGWADQFSDVEVVVVWGEPPSDEQRLAAVERCGGAIDVDWGTADRMSWLAALARRDGAIGQMWPIKGDDDAEKLASSLLDGSAVAGAALPDEWRVGWRRTHPS